MPDKKDYFDRINHVYITMLSLYFLYYSIILPYNIYLIELNYF